MANDRDDTGTPDSHGVHGTERGDSKEQEQPEASDSQEAGEWADQVETGGQATD